MLINGKNLLIAAHCADAPDPKERIINHLQITGTATVATNGAYSIAVSMPETAENIKPFYISRDLALKMSGKIGRGTTAIDENYIGAEPIPPVSGKFPVLEGFCANKPATMEIDLSAKFLLAIAQSLVEFGGDIARIKIISPEYPIRLESRDPITGQKWEALLMGHKPGVHDARFAQPVPPAQSHQWEPDFSDGEPATDSKTCGICGDEHDPLAAAIAEAQRLMGQ